MAEYKKLKRAVIKEELYNLTGDFRQAIVLNQFIYWSERVKDSKNFMLEELERGRRFADGSSETPEDISESLKNGWIYKTADDMIDEVMLSVSRTTMQRVIDRLVENDWVNRRTNPKYHWDKTYQYRVNLHKIQTDLLKIGYSLEGYSLQPESAESSNVQIESSSVQIELSSVQNEHSSVQIEHSNVQIEQAIPEITTEITSENVLTLKNEEEEYIYNQISDSVYFEELKNTLLEKGCSLGMIKKTIVECHKQQVTSFTVKAVLDQYEHMMEKELNASKGIGKPIYDFPQYFAEGLKRRTETLYTVKSYEGEKKEKEAERVSSKVPFYNWLEDKELYN